MSMSYKLDITDATHNNKLHSLSFPGIKTWLEVKMDVSDLIDLPVSRQKWTGLPPNVTDDVVPLFLSQLLKDSGVMVCLACPGR